MATSKISYPHPVLGNGDDISIGEISPSVDYEIRDETVHLSINGLTTGHAEIDQMVQDGDAVWHFRVQCSRTYMRDSFSANDVSFDIRLKGQDYEGMVDVETSVVATSLITEYRPSGIHEDYGDEVFQLSPGEVLCIGPSFRFLVDKVYDPLKAPVASLVRITKGDHKDGPFTLTLDDDLIIVGLSRSDWADYAGIRDRVPTVVHSAVILPALAEAIREIDKHIHTLWGGRLKTLLEAKGIDEGAPLAAAQEILASPVTRTISEVNAILDTAEA